MRETHGIQQVAKRGIKKTGSIFESSKYLIPQKIHIHPRSLTWPLKIYGLEDYFPFGMVYFQGRTVKLQVGIP